MLQELTATTPQLFITFLSRHKHRCLSGRLVKGAGVFALCHAANYLNI